MWFRVIDGERELHLDRRAEAGSREPVLQVGEPELIRKKRKSLLDFK